MDVPSDHRALKLGRSDRCALCATPQPRGTNAYWSPSVRRVYCQACVGGAELALAHAGTAGAGAAREHARRSDRDALETQRRWGKLAPIATKLGAPKPSTTSWAKGAAGEQRLAAFLEHELAGSAILLHDRRIPGSRANIDHIAVGPSGIWVIDAKRYTGRVQRRDVGGLFRSDIRLFVGGRDQTRLVKKMPRQVATIRAALETVPAFVDAPVNAAICFTNSDWGFLNLGKPFSIDNVLITYPGALRTAIHKPAVLTHAFIGRLAARLAVELPPA